MASQEAWQKLADLLRERREEQGLSQRDLADAAGTTDRLISAIERTERTTFKPHKLRAIAKAVGWTGDSVNRILTGKEPVDASEETAEPFRREMLLDRAERDTLDRIVQLERQLAVLHQRQDVMQDEIARLRSLVEPGPPPMSSEEVEALSADVRAKTEAARRMTGHADRGSGAA